MKRVIIFPLVIIISLVIQANTNVNKTSRLVNSVVDNFSTEFKISTTNNQPSAVQKKSYLPIITKDNTIKQEMITIPEGIFQMGCDLNNPDEIDCTQYWTNGNELPLHTVSLPEYKIDKYEVTNSMYRRCVMDEVCREPENVYSYDRVSYYDNVNFENFPVIWISWYDAKEYCTWVGKRLPTEAEWEKAARGPNFSTQKYPWGNSKKATCEEANFIESEYPNECESDTTMVGSYPTGESNPYKMMDMAGNVWEWVNDWYQYDYYVESPYFNPQGPPETTTKVARGGSFNYLDEDIRVARRAAYDPDFRGNYLGFRCAK